MRNSWMLAITLTVACGGPSTAMSTGDQKMIESGGKGADAAAAYGPLTVGADWSTYAKVNRAPFPSPTHGDRMVDVYVTPAALAAYKNADAEISVGTILVKTSKQKDGGEGPIFVMEKRAPGFAPDHGDWYFAMHWAEPTEAWKKKLGGPVYWRSPSPRVEYCSDCHDGYDRGIGGVPTEAL